MFTGIVRRKLAVLCGGWMMTCCLMGAPDTNATWFARVWQSDDGLPENNVTGITQTPEGYLWVSTLNGLARLDGIRFQPIPVRIPNGNFNQMFRCLLRGRGSTLWMASEGGMVIQLGPASTNIYTTNNGLARFRPVVMAQDAAGAVWIAYVDGSACCIRNGQVTRYRARDGLSGVGPCWLASDSAGRIWFAKAGRVGLFKDTQFSTLYNTDERVVRIAGARNEGIWILTGRQLLRYSEDAGASLCSAFDFSRSGFEPTVLHEDRSHAVWLGTAANGLYRFDGSNITHVDTSHAEIRTIAEDREGNIWVGTSGGGLNRLQPKSIELQGLESGLPIETVRSICQDESSVIWAITQNGEIARLNGEKWMPVSTNSGWPGDKATCVTPDGHGGVWIGTWHGGLYHWQKDDIKSIRKNDGLASDTIRAMMRDSASNLWIALESSNCVQRLNATGIQTYVLPRASSPVRTIIESSNRVIWMGSSDGYLFRIDGTNIVDETALTLSRPKPIRCLMPGNDGSVWIGYAGAGIGQLKNNRFFRITTEQGLHDDYISQMVADNRGLIWLAGNRGIFHITQRELDEVVDGRRTRIRSVVHGRDESLPSLQANFGYGPGSLHSKDGRIWLPMRTGLAVVFPGRKGLSHFPPPVVIERIIVDGHVIPLPDGDAWQNSDKALSAPMKPILLPPDYRKLEVEYTALSFIAPENVHFRHRLEGVDEDWNPAGAQRSVSYPRFPAGNYFLKITACSSSGLWNLMGVELEFVVKPFFWQTWWFRFGTLLLFTLSIIGIVRYVSFKRLRQRLQLAEKQTALHKERERIAKDIHDDLGAKLTQISLLGELAQHDLEYPQKAHEHVEKLSGHARQGIKALDEIVWAVNPRNDTLPHLLDYAGQYAIDFLQTADIACRLDFPASIPIISIPAEVRHHVFLVIKESLHNIVKHSQAATVWIKVGMQKQTLQISIEDDGKGFEHAPVSPMSDGLINMKQRMAEVGGTCWIESRPQHGTAIHIQVPLQT